jgi:DNA-binding LacI/PurR family transcriptional regulator
MILFQGDEMRNTIKEVAREAGVSVATVSRVLNGKDRVREETRIRVKSAIKKLNFKPDQIAVSLSNSKSMSVGLLVPNMRNEYWALLSQAIEERLWEHGYTLLLSTTNNIIDREIANVNFLLNRKIDGLIFGKNLPANIAHYQDVINSIMKAEIPVVSFESGVLGQIQITSDGQAGAMEAVQHLINLGHKDIAYIGGSQLIDERELGYRNALMLNGLSIQEELIFKGSPSYSLGKEAVEKLQEAGKKYTAVFCWNDITALGLIKALQRLGIHVPDDIAVVGFDNISMADIYNPSLTTVEQPVKEMGTAAVDYLMNYIQNPGTNKGHQKIAFKTSLIIRESCGIKK